MKRARDIMGLPVVCSQTGTQVGVAKDLLVGDDWQVLAMTLETKQWFSDVMCVLYDDIKALGSDAVMVGQEKSLCSIELAGEGRTLLDGPNKLRGLPVLTANGMQLGLIEDVYLDPDKGRQVIAFELTDGFISDIRDGRKQFPLPDSITVGEDAVIVPASSGEVLEQMNVSNGE